MTLINGIKSHLFTCFNMKTIYKNLGRICGYIVF